ncbi:MAG: TlpA family protein disulfide reductase [Candidatus Puniceispirillales bacterium]
MFNSLKYLLILSIIIPFPSQSNSLFQKIDIKLENNVILNDEKNIEKKLFDIFDLNSKYVLNFWATWCIPCKKELPDLKKMKMDNKDLKVVIISIDKKSIKDQLNFLKKNKVNELTSYYDQNMTFFKNLKLRGIPTTLLIKQQKIIAKKEGIFSYNKNSLEQINNFFN